MRKTTIDEVYERACGGAGRMPEEHQYQAWERVLSPFPAAMIDAALTQWQGDTSEDRFSGMARGRLMPAPADLKAIIEANERKAVSANKYTPCGIGGCIQGLVAYRKDGSLWNWRTDQRESRYWRDCDCKIEWRERVGKAS